MKKKRQTSFLIFCSLLLLVVLSACAADGGTGTTTTPPAPTATTPPTPAPTPDTAAPIKTASATVDGKAVTILTDAKGLTLYYFKPDKLDSSACVAGCATNWPPVITTSTEAPKIDGLTGTLTLVTTSHGSQFAYNGYLLYTFANDKAAGELKGQGVGQNWFVVTTDITAKTDSATADSAAPIKTASATVDGKAATILTDAKGLTLYYFKPDKLDSSTCVAGCATNWPPITTTGTEAPKIDGLTGALTVVKTVHGNQLAYNGYLLYTFVNDKAAGELKGQGVGGNWFVVTTDIAAKSASTSDVYGYSSWFVIEDQTTSTSGSSTWSVKE